MLETPSQSSDGKVARDDARPTAARPRADQPGSLWAAVDSVRQRFPERMLDHEFARIDMRHWASVPDFTLERFGGYDENGEPVID